MASQPGPHGELRSPPIRPKDLPAGRDASDWRNAIRAAVWRALLKHASFLDMKGAAYELLDLAAELSFAAGMEHHYFESLANGCYRRAAQSAVVPAAAPDPVSEAPAEEGAGEPEAR